MTISFRFGLRFVFAAMTIAGFLSIGLAAATPALVRMWTGQVPFHYIPEVETRYNAFRAAVMNEDFAKVEAMLTPEFRSEMTAPYAYQSYRVEVPPPITSKGQVRGDGDVAMVVFKMANPNYSADEGEYYIWRKIEGEWYLSRIDFRYYLS